MNYYSSVDVALPTKTDCTRRPPPGWDAPLVTFDDGEQKALIFLYFKNSSEDNIRLYQSILADVTNSTPVLFYFWEDLLSACMDVEPAYLITDALEAIRGICTWCDPGDRITNYMLVGELSDSSSLKDIPIDRLDISAARLV